MTNKTITIEIMPPIDNSFTELLRFYCQTCVPNDPSLPFMASMWSYAIANDSLTGKQAKSASLYLNHRLKEFGLGEVKFDD